MRAPRRVRRWLRENPEKITVVAIGVAMVALASIVLLLVPEFLSKPNL